MAYDPTNRGTLSRNNRKTEDRHPDFTGQLNVEGTDYWLSGWVQERKDGSGKFFSLSIRKKDTDRRPPPKPTGGIAEMPDDVPF